VPLSEQRSGKQQGDKAMAKSKPQPVAFPPENLDPFRINARLLNQISKLLDQLEDPHNAAEITIPQRINALIAVGRVQIMFDRLRKASDDRSNSGAAVRKYAQAFQANAARGRAAFTRPGAEPAGVDEDDPDYLDALDDDKPGAA
jgi:hypothetical protein